MPDDNPQGDASKDCLDEDCRVVLDSIRRIVQTLRRSAHVSEKRLGLSSAQLFVLTKLADAQSYSVGELAERTLTSQSSVSEVVQKLVTAGYVARVRSARDARSVELSLTQQGREVIAMAPVAPQDYILAGLKRMPPRDRRQLGKLLTRLVKETGMVNVTPSMLFADAPERLDANPRFSSAADSAPAVTPSEATLPMTEP